MKKASSILHKLRFQKETSFTVVGTKWLIKKRETDFALIVVKGMFNYDGRRVYTKNSIVECFAEIEALIDYLVRQNVVNPKE
jgi:hypothetical protein